MTALMWAHASGGVVAIASGTIAISARKGNSLHAAAGSIFALSMFLLGATATILSRSQPEPELGLGGLLTCYLVATSWMAARRRGAAGRMELAAGVLVMALAAAIGISGATGTATTPVGRGPIFASAAVCLYAGLLDLSFALRKQVTNKQRLRRHLWRMCVAFFIATGSFFIGQQGVLPSAVRGSPLLFAAGFAPLVVLLFWLARLSRGKPMSSQQPQRATDAQAALTTVVGPAGTSV